MQRQQFLENQVAEVGRRFVDNSQFILDSIASWVRSIDWPRIAQALILLGNAISKLVPPNHRELGRDYWPKLRELARTEQLCLAWAPDVHLAKALLDADSGSARDEILLERRQEILNSCRDVVDHLHEVVETTIGEDLDPAVAQPTTERLLGTGKLLQQAIESVAAGHTASGQALATCVVDTLIGQQINPDDRGKAHTFLKRAIKEAAGQEMVAVALGDTLDAVESSYRGPGSWSKQNSSEPTRYSRHATIHAVGPSVFSDVFALKAVLMATSVLALACSPILPALLALLSDSWLPANSLE